MKNILKRAALLIAAVFFVAFSAGAESTSIDHLYSYTLDNGLSVFVAENHSAPLVYIEVAVRAGSIAQTPENAGLFHFYEHLMFKGNSKYRNSQAFQRGLKDMGVTDSNGMTSIDRVNYFITVPVDQFEKGLEFWSCAIREPLMDPKEFEEEKKVVISEIQGYFGQPSQQATYYTIKNLYPEAPWTYDAGGTVENIQNATIEQIKKIQNTYYVPDNAAVFVGGDINPDYAYEMVKKYFGEWKKAEDPWKEKGTQFDIDPLKAPKYCVLPYDAISPQIAQINLQYRGPDADYDLENTYIADVFFKILSDPSGVFKKSILKNKNLQIPNADYVWSGYQTSRQHGLISIGSVVLNTSENLPLCAKEFYETLIKNAFPAVQKDKSLESEAKRKILLQTLKDSTAYERETAEGLISVLSYYWCYASRDYYFSYADKLAQVTKKDFDSFLDKYIYSSNPLIIVYVNPAVYEQTKEAFDNAGFEEISADNAFWWGK